MASEQALMVNFSSAVTPEDDQLPQDEQQPQDDQVASAGTADAVVSAQAASGRKSS
jgi:hypothetical protein